MENCNPPHRFHFRWKWDFGWAITSAKEKWIENTYKCRQRLRKSWFHKLCLRTENYILRKCRKFWYQAFNLFSTFQQHCFDKYTVRFKINVEFSERKEHGCKYLGMMKARRWLIALRVLLFTCSPSPVTVEEAAVSISYWDVCQAELNAAAPSSLHN